MWFYILIAVIIIILLYVLILFNSFIKWDNKVKEAFSTMDIYLKKRWDLIPNLVDNVKAYAKYEKDTLESVINLRNRVYDNMSLEDKLKINEELGKSLNKIMLLKEDYPDLLANENFKNLSQELVKMEEDIANSRKYYNAVVRLYNNKIEMFPNNLFAKLFGYKTKTMFEAKEMERENVNIEL